jgi:hypothetical protein
MQFETEYQLQQFRDIQGEHFDSDGKIFAGNGREHSLAEQMLKLIDQLEREANRCQCPECRPHASDCAVHNMPAYPNGECNCR